jgi:hypothetical protein
MFRGRAMAFVIYLVVAVVTVFGVLLEMDVLVEPAHKVVTATQKTAAPQFAPAVPQVQPTTDARGSEPALPRRAAGPVSDKCDVTACAVAYTSFRASDCTYQPSEGPRQLCTKGVASDPKTAEAVLNAHAEGATGSAAPASCHVAACQQAYISFTANDCTYQPLEGPRRLCTK